MNGTDGAVYTVAARQVCRKRILFHGRNPGLVLRKTSSHYAGGAMTYLTTVPLRNGRICGTISHGISKKNIRIGKKAIWCIGKDNNNVESHYGHGTAYP